jgi:hypothetical protein
MSPRRAAAGAPGERVTELGGTDRSKPKTYTNVLNSASVVNNASGSPVASNAISAGEDRVEHQCRHGQYAHATRSGRRKRPSCAAPAAISELTS